MSKKIGVFVVSVDDYLPELSSITMPRIKEYAERIDAEFTVISERKFPDFPPTYEKMQIHELGKNNDYNILLDADMLLGDSFEDITQNVRDDSVGFWHQYDASYLFVPDEYFHRDGRRVGVATNMLVVPRSCHDIFTPLEFSAKDARLRTKRWFIIDEYCVSRNLAKFGLKYACCVSSEDEFLHLNVTTDGLANEIEVANDWIKKNTK